MSKTEAPTPQPTTLQKILAYGVHVYTSTGVVWGVLAAYNIAHNNFLWAYLWLLIAVLVDSSDGFLARTFRVKEFAPSIDGRTLDDIADYLNYTFLPLWMVWQAGWLPEPGWLWISFTLMASLFGFGHTGAKEEDEGFFRGFPSYWNFFAFYTDICFRKTSPYAALAILIFFTILNVAPLRFVYPTRAKRWKLFFVGGALLWTVFFVYILKDYPNIPLDMAWLSIWYPALYIILSVYLDFSSRAEKRRAQAQS